MASKLGPRFSEEYINWNQGGKALECVAGGLTDLCKAVVGDFHKELRLKFGDTECNAGCTGKEIVRKFGPDEKTYWIIDCPNNICNKWLDGIASELATSQCTWENSEITKWSTEPWQLAKVFMACGQQKSNVDPAQTGVLGLLQLMENCRKFHSHLDTQKAEKVRGIRNQLFHSHDFSVTRGELNAKLADMVALLQDRTTLYDDISAQEAVHEIQAIQDFELDDIDDEFLEEERNVWKQTIEECTPANREAIIEFICTHKDLEKGLRGEVEQLKKKENETKARLQRHAYENDDLLKLSMEIKNSKIQLSEQIEETKTQLLKRTAEIQREVEESKSQNKPVESPMLRIPVQEECHPSQDPSQSSDSGQTSTQDWTRSGESISQSNVTGKKRPLEVRDGKNDDDIDESMKNIGDLNKNFKTNNDQPNDSLLCVKEKKYQLQGNSFGNLLWELQDIPTESSDKFGMWKKVRVTSDEKEARKLQEGHGGWVSPMEKYLGRIGTIRRKLKNVIGVQFPDGQIWGYNEELLQPCIDETEECPDEGRPFKRYDVVCIEKDKDRVMKLQEGHGGWNPNMASILQYNGVVTKVDEDNDVSVACCNNTEYRFNPKLLEIIDTSKLTIEVGDSVMVIDSYKKVKDLQDKDHGGWVETMRETLGLAGTVIGVLLNGRARVLISDRQWIYNVEALRHIDRSGIPKLNAEPEQKNLLKDALGESLTSGMDVIAKALVMGRSNKYAEHFGVGEQVRVDSDQSNAIQLQKGHGEWNAEMEKYLGKVGTIKAVEQPHIITVQFSDGKMWTFNKALLQPYDGETDQEEEMSQPFKRNDIVCVEKDKETVMTLQEGHGGWKPGMASILGLNGTVTKVGQRGDVFVACCNNSTYLFNPKLLEVIDTSKLTIEVGDSVLVIDSYKKVKDLQDKDHGGWVEALRETLGSPGTVIHILPNECASVLISGHQWIYNVKALRFLTRMGVTSNKDLSESSDKGFGIGELVRVDSDEAKVVQLQEGHGEFHSKMKKYLGKIGIIKVPSGPLPPNTVPLQFSDGNAMIWNKENLQPYEGESALEEGEKQPFKRYDIVCVEKDKEKVMTLQEGHGGWKPGMASILDKNGIVNRVDMDGDIHVEFKDDTERQFNPKLLTVIDTTNMALKIGDFVLVIDSYKKVKALQDKDQGWNENMRKILGAAGTVIEVLPNGQAGVFIGGRPWKFNVKALRFISRTGETNITTVDKPMSEGFSMSRHLANSWHVYVSIIANVSLFSLVWFRLK